MVAGCPRIEKSARFGQPDHRVLPAPRVRRTLDPIQWRGRRSLWQSKAGRP